MANRERSCDVPFWAVLAWCRERDRIIAGRWRGDIAQYTGSAFSRAIFVAQNDSEIAPPSRYAQSARFRF